MSDEQSKVRAFVLDHIGNPDVGDDEDLFTSGLVSSLFAVQIVTWVERALGAQVGPADLDIDNFRSITAIAGFVRRKRAVPAP